jgi:hypothetical protein
MSLAVSPGLLGWPMENVGSVLGVIALLALAGLAMWWHYGRSTSVLEQWASKNRYRIISKE